MFYVYPKSILSNKNGMNIYRGCSHGCIYCDSRSACYNISHDFENIEVKINAPELLEVALKKKRNKCMIGTGSMSDPYLHLEKELSLTRRCLEVIERYGFGLAILTKSDMILRDIDLIDKINKKTKAVVQLTLTTFDDKLCKIIEPNVCVTSKRVEVLKTCQKLNIPTVVWMCPILPFINDSEENLRGLLNYCVQSGVKGIVNFGFGVTLRQGDREYFLKKLDEYFPGAKDEYLKRFGYSYENNSPRNEMLYKIFVEECKKANILYKPNEVFDYLNEFPNIDNQISLF